jgi:hypothetical protein
MPDLKIQFEFLCAFVPPTPFSAGPKSCYVVLPDFRSPPKTHLPVLLYDRQDRVPDQDLPPGLTPKEAGKRSPTLLDTWDKLDFGSEEVDIQPDGQPFVGADSLVTSSNLDAILPIAKAGVGMEVFDQKLLRDVTPKVACRLLLRQGTLESAELTADAFGVYDLTKTPPMVHSQKMARRVVLSIGFTSFVDLVFRRLGVPAERRLRLKNSTGVTLTLRNCEPDLVWSHSFPAYKDQFDDEIDLFFALSRAYNAAAPPRKILLKLATAGPNGICAPKAFDGFGG